MEDTEVIALGKEVAKLLNGWEFQVDSDMRDRCFFVSGQMKFGFNRDYSGKRDRLNISTWRWPEYTRIERGEQRKETIFPNSLYDPKESGPEISVAINRGAAAIANEIKRRFLPDYGRIWERCAEKARMYQESHNKAIADWMAICKVMGKTPTHDHHYEGAMSITNRSGSAHIELDATPEQFAAIYTALRGLKKEAA